MKADSSKSAGLKNNADIFPETSRSLAKKHLPPKLFKTLAGLETKSGFTIAKAVASGIANPDSSIGIYAGDKESYKVFNRVFTPIINEYHKLKAGLSHKNQCKAVPLPLLDPENKFIKSTRIRVARNIAHLPFPPHMSRAQRLHAEQQAIDAMSALPFDLAGTYTAFSKLSPESYRELLEEKLAFPKGDRFQDAAGINKDFPLGRGVFLSHDKKFRVWVNEEDHLRIIALSYDSDLAGVFARLIRGLDELGSHLDFAHDPALGFLSSCPTNIGTAMRAGVHIHLEKLEKHPSRLKEIVTAHHLQIRGTGGEKTAVDNAIFDISNARRLGVSANDIVQDLHAGLQAVIKAENEL